MELYGHENFLRIFEVNIFTHLNPELPGCKLGTSGFTAVPGKTPENPGEMPEYPGQPRESGLEPRESGLFSELGKISQKC